MSIEQKFLQLLKNNRYIPLKLKEIAAKLGLTPKDIPPLQKTLNTLEKKGTVARIKHDRFAFSKDADLLGGIIKFRQSGAAIVIPDESHTKLYPDPIPIRAENTSTALNGDLVLIRLSQPKPAKSQKKPTPLLVQEPLNGKVIKILKRNNLFIIGTLQKTKTFYYVFPDDPKIIHDIIVKEKNAKKANVGDKVVVELSDWQNRHVSPEGFITKVLGKTHEPNVEHKAILLKYNLDPNFPKNVIENTKAIPLKVLSADFDNRQDCTSFFTITIDPDDAKDFDDALSYEELPQGAIRIGVHIADVSAYVKSDTPLDKEAKKRGNSTYLVECVVPMLPHALSNGICSLVEGQNRLTKTVFFTFKNNKIQQVEFANTVIRSCKRLTYHQAYAFLTKKSLEDIKNTPLPPSHQTGSTGRSLKKLSNKELSELQYVIKKFWNIASHLRKKRMQEGSLDFDMPETKIYIDKEGRSERIEKIEQDESHQLIEEFMLAANEIIAKELSKAKLPFISRVHDEPDPEKLTELTETFFNYGITTGDLSNRKHITQLLQKIKHHPQGHLLKIHFLRSLKQACYRAESAGHYGLYKVHYAHFTSPIRRYSDLIVHRIFDNLLIKRKNPTAPLHTHKKYSKQELDVLAKHLTITEQNSTEADRESVKVKLLEFFQLELKKPQKQIFKAIITEIKNHGMFIELKESMAFGFIHLSTLKDDLYQIRKEGATLVGRRTKKTFTIGQEINVIVHKVDRFKRQIDFILAAK